MPYMRDSSGRRLDSFTVADASANQTGGPARRLVADGDIWVKTGGNTNAAWVWRTDRNRLVLIVANTTSDTLMIAEGTIDVDGPPASGYTSIPPGSEYVTTTALPVYGYFSATAGFVRVYAELAS